MTLAMETVRCALCSSDSATTILVGNDFEYGLTGDFAIDECGQCGHYYLNPRPAASEISQLYPDNYAPFEAGVAASSRIRRIRERIAELIQFGETIRTVDQGTLIEIGCGTGEWLERFSRNGWESTGIEPSASACATAKERGVDVVHGTEEALDEFEAGSFDRLHAFMVLEHTPDPIATLRRLHRVARPDATLCLSVPNFGHSSRSKYGEYWHSLHLPRHFHHFTSASIARALDASGWELDRLWYQPSLIDTWQSVSHQAHHAGKRDWRLRLLPFRSAINIAILPALFWLAQRRGSSRMTVTATRRGND